MVRDTAQPPAPARAFLEALLAERVHEQTEIIESHLALFLATGEPDGVFRQRTGLNRLLTYLAIARSIHLEHDIAETAIALRDWRKRFGRVRDFDVMMECLERLGVESGKGAAAASNWLSTLLGERRDKRFAKLCRRIEEGGADELRATVATWRAWADARESGAGREPRSESQRAKMLAAIEATILPPLERAWLDLRGPAAERPDDERLHYFRIANKRLRDVAEVLCEAAPAWAEALETLRALHKILGNMHDLAVLIDEVNRLRLEAASEGDVSAKRFRQLSALRQRIDAAREEEFLALLALWPRLHEPDFEALLKGGQ